MEENLPFPQELIRVEITKQLEPLIERAENERCIFKVPTQFKQPDKYAYSPSIVSIGLFHHGLLDLKEHKRWYTLYFLQRTPNALSALNKCVDALWKLKEKSRQCYAEHMYCDDRDLVEILLLDGCFILEVFMKCWDKEFDPISSNALMVRTIRLDLALLENQIPFFILEELFDTVKKSVLERDDPLAKCSLPGITMHFFETEKLPEGRNRHSLDMVHKLYETKKLPEGGSRHLLDVLHKLYDYKSKEKEKEMEMEEEKEMEMEEEKGFRDCATKLSEAGIVFQKGTQGDDLLCIKFDHGIGKVTIPPFSVDQIIVLRNLLAYEQCSCSTKYHITSYAVLMKSLIHSLKDIELLQEKGIIGKEVGAAEGALAFVNPISTGVVYKYFYFTKLCAEVNEYSQSWWHWHRIKALLLVKWRRYFSELYRDHLSNPWRTASAIAAIVLLVLTLMQTIYTMRS